MVAYLAPALGAIALALSFSVPSANAVERGLGWATDNQFAKQIAGPEISWYYHWQNGPVSQMPSHYEFVPMNWGHQYANLWNQRVAEMNKNPPKHIMSYNEPDVQSQSSMDPNAAASDYMKEIFPWSKKGVQLGSPCIVWNVNWMNTFMQAIQKQGGHVDFFCIHWYGSWNDMAGFQKWVQTVHTRFGKKIWVPELGITSASHPSQAQVKNFMVDAFAWLDSQSYVERAAWFGCFESNNPPDNFAVGLNGLFQSGGKLSDMGKWYSSSKSKRSLRSRHRQIAARNTTDSDGPVHCDSTCQLRNSQIEQYLATP